MLLAPAFAAEPPAPPVGGFTVTPIRLELAAGHRAATVTVSSATETRKTIQTEVFRWRQDAEGADVYDPTGDLLINPPLFFVPPNGSQVVRVGLASGAKPDRAVEQTYRIFFREVPADRGDGETGIRMALRMGVPLFIKPEHDTAVPLRWSVRVRGHDLRLAVENPGTSHVRLSEVTLWSNAASAPLAKAEGFRYVLAGARQVWKLVATEGVRPGPGRITALSESGAVEFPIGLEAD